MSGHLAGSRRGDIATQTYRRIASAISVGEIKFGQAVTATKWAEELGVPEAAALDAIARMVMDGVLVADESGSFALPSCSHEHVREILLIRRELESMAAAHAAKRATRPFISELESLRDLQRNAENYRTWTAANHAFHFQIYEAANMPALVDIIDELWRETGPYLIEAMDAACASNSLLRQEQDKIISALHTKNARAARAAMADELDGLSAFILSNLRTEPLHRAAG